MVRRFAAAERAAGRQCAHHPASAGATVAGAGPAGLQAQLCTVNRCIPLGGGSGSSNGLQGEPANAELRFVLRCSRKAG
ncbi:flagellar protein FlhE [Serratia ureilytica]